MTNDAEQKSKFPSEPLAIVGMACRLPGADNLDSFWDLLIEGKSGISEMPDDRMNRRLFLTDKPGQDSKTYASISGLIPSRPNDPPANFRTMDQDQLKWDPCHEILCGVVDEARLNAGWSKSQLSESRTGVYVGHSCGTPLGGEIVLASIFPEVAEALSALPEFRDLPESERNQVLTDIVGRIQHQRPTRRPDQPFLEANIAAQLIADRHQLEGPQMVIDAACASSLVALALASAALTKGEIDQAVVSSASYAKTDSMILFSLARSCSATASRPFDADADGLVNAEGYIAIIVKTLAKARMDGDKIQAVIRGIGISSDGRGRSLWAPRKEGQLVAVQRAYSGTITKESVQYVEAHATSTQVGDATELEALAAYFRTSSADQKLPLGSVKSNIGHTLESAGLASLVKCVLSMQKGMIPPTINLTTLNPALDWSQQPFAPVMNAVPWPDVPLQPRRSAVNAFGIGGLNAHIIVDGPPQQQPLPVAQSRAPMMKTRSNRKQRTGHRLPDESNSIAIIGRGLVIPGAREISSFQALLESGESQLVRPPQDRWRDTPFMSTRPAIQRAYKIAKGGYIQDYKYDWRKHHIPPLQIEVANPLQFMLLEATQQALDESGYSDRPYDRMRAAVVVGTLFGGDFSHQLQVGLRVNEIVDELSNTLRKQGWDESRIQKACKNAEKHILKHYPAISDQTGSFTCSTQASRIAKVLDVMGGAMAIDSGDCSSFAALQSAYHLLGSGIVDYAFCAAAQRDLDSAAFEAWNYRQFEAASAQPRDGSEPLYPGEGVVVLMLRRLSDAVASGDHIYGIIRDVHAIKPQRNLENTNGSLNGSHDNHLSSNVPVRTPDSSSLTRQFGHLQAASGLLEILALTTKNSKSSAVPLKTNVQIATGPCSFLAEFESSVVQVPIPQHSVINHAVPDTAKHVEPDTKQHRELAAVDSTPVREIPAQNNLAPANKQATLPSKVTEIPKSEVLHRSEKRPAPAPMTTTNEASIYRVWGVDPSELLQKLASLMPSTSNDEDRSEAIRFPVRAPYRLAFVASEADFQNKRQLAMELVEGRISPIRLQDQGIYFSDCPAATKPQSAVMFPGQGSQRSGMLADLIQSSPAATKMLELADRSLSHRSLGRCSDWILGHEPIHDNDLRSTQLAMLAADVCGYQVAREWGIQPDLFIGHSFGEYAALVSAGTLDLDAAISITLARAEAVAGCDHGHGAMLSIAASPKEVRPLLENQTGLYISHRNSPRQTVVAGTSAGITKLAESLKSRGLPAIQVPVGSPFHTPLLEGAVSALKVALNQHRWRPPRVPVLSTVSGRFIADRQDIVQNLAQQLTQPLDWVSCIERLLSEDVQVFIEVGPGRVLSKLTQQIIGERSAFIISIDDTSISIAERQLRIRAALETAGITDAAMPLVKPLKLAPAAFSFAKPVLQPEIEVAEVPLPTVAVAAAPSTAEPNEAASITEAEDAAVPGLSSEDALAEFLTNVIVEQTGYPREIIEFDWDLEADLGIDSIRKAMILGELREFFDLEEELDRNVFQELHTLRDILNLLRRTSGKGDWLQTSKKQLETSPVATVVDSPVDVEEPAEALIQTSGSDLGEFLIDFIVERTGYPRDVIDLDADLESDLGIDSIAKAQLVGEVRDHFKLTIDDATIRAALGDLRTLRQLRELVEGSSPSDGAAPRPTPPVQSDPARSVKPSPQRTPSEEPVVVAQNGSGLHAYESSSYSRDYSSIPEDSELAEAFHRGQAWGAQHKTVVQNRLFDAADRAGIAFAVPESVVDKSDGIELTSLEDAELKGVAHGANVHPQNVFSIRDHLKLPLNGTSSVNGSDDDHTHGTSKGGSSVHEPVHHHADPSAFTQRFRLEMSPADNRKWSGAKPDFAGGAIVLGDHPECAELVRRLESLGAKVSWIRKLGSRTEAVAELDRVWQSAPSPHLFVMTPRDQQTSFTFDESEWKRRRESGVSSLYWFCQRWLYLVEQAKLLDDASLIGATALGGDFGVSHNISSPESGALAGLLKAIVIETWVNGYRTLPVKILDFPRDSAAESVTNAILVELTEPSYDVEIGWNGEARSVLRSIPSPVDLSKPQTLKPSGNWIVTGGARGITAYVVKQMAAKYPQVHFHLIGTAPAPTLSDEQRRLAQTDLTRLRAEVMQQAKSDRQSPLKAWQAVEKAIEIDRSLTEFRAAGIHTTYHSCDVADRAKMASVLSGIRQKSGPIFGVIHGAGIGKDASFQKKEPSMVEQCLSAKLDGVLNLMLLTREDPLQAFIAFGSISGRFGANGHTDYSMANDMLAKLIGWHRQQRPSLPTAVFHWHAWDDIGMAIKPETRLALEMIGMKLMPAKEGAAHFLKEIAAGLPQTEVLITDTRYYRMFYPADRMLAQPIVLAEKSNGDLNWPLIVSGEATSADSCVCKAVLNPVTDPFLRDHRLRDRPLLPMVIMSELLAESASYANGASRPTVMRNLEITTSIKFPTDSPCDVRISSKRASDGSTMSELRADFYSRNGKLVSPDRLYAKAAFEFEPHSASSELELKFNRDALTALEWKPAQYPPAGAPFYVGGPLNCLRKFALDLDKQTVWGRISAPSLSELAGPQRDVSRWLTPSAVLDATLFTSGILAWTVRPGVALPQGVKEIKFYRCPRPAEICWVRSQIVRRDPTELAFDITVWGNDDRPLMFIKNYVAAWLPE